MSSTKGRNTPFDVIGVSEGKEAGNLTSGMESLLSSLRVVIDSDDDRKSVNTLFSTTNM